MLNGAGLDPHLIFSEFDVAPHGALIVAVSGGSDSLALLFLLQAFLCSHAPAKRLVAVTVDHGLRPESAREAETVAELCAAHGIGHRIMRWVGAKPERGIAAAAREARYRLLAEAAAMERTDIVLTGHTLDDQLETVAMRKARGEGRGLAGMAPATLYDGRVWIVRPLLGTARAALRGYLAERGIRWIEDPTNVDRRYERARVRAGDTAAAARDLGPAIAAATNLRITLGKAAAGLIRSHGELAAPGLVALHLSFCERHFGQAAVYALRILLASLGGAEQLPDIASGTALFERIIRESFRSTLSRVVIDAAVRAIFFRRERRSLPGPGQPPSGSIWDGRFLIADMPKGASLAPVGIDVANMIVRHGPPPFQVMSETPPSFVAAALAAEPALWRDGEFAGLAAEAGVAKRIVAPWARFLPSFDLAPASAVAELIGAKRPPNPPFAGHK